MKDYKDLLDPSRIPAHIGIIMDGNGRWAKKMAQPRAEGHKKGAEVIEPLMDTCLELGVKAVSLYAFSTENWRRPSTEVFALWKLLDYFFSTKLETIKQKGIAVRHSGTTAKLPPHTKKTILNAVDETRKNKKAVLNLCINYGGRQEIVDGVNQWLSERGTTEKFTMGKMEKYLYTAGLPDVDLVIRTSGEYRISNFLLWQLAYAELAFIDILWPDFMPEHLYKIIYDYQQRERRYGGL